MKRYYDCIIDYIVSNICCFIGGFFVVMKVLFDQRKQQFAINKRCKELDNNLKPIRLNFIVQSYNICMKNEQYECAGKLLSMIKEEFPEDYKKMGFNV